MNDNKLNTANDFIGIPNLNAASIESIRTDALAMAIKTFRIGTEANDLNLNDAKEVIGEFALGFEQYICTGLFPMEWDTEYPEVDFEGAEVV